MSISTEMIITEIEKIVNFYIHQGFECDSNFRLAKLSIEKISEFV